VAAGREGGRMAARQRIDRHQPGVAGGTEPERRRAKPGGSAPRDGSHVAPARKAIAGPEQVEQVEERAHGDGAAPVGVERRGAQPLL
jgi:hypothetical protein